MQDWYKKRIHESKKWSVLQNILKWDSINNNGKTWHQNKLHIIQYKKNLKTLKDWKFDCNRLFGANQCN